MKSRLPVNALSLSLGLLAGVGFADWVNAPSAPPPSTAASGPGPATPREASSSSATATTPASAPTAPALVASAESASSVVDYAGEPAWKMLARVAPPRDAPDRWLKLPVLRAKGPPPPEHSLNPEFAEFFGLGAEEQARIEAALDDSIAQQGELDLAHARLIPIRPSDGFLAQYEQAFAIEAYPEQGAALHDRLNRSLSEVLGEERMTVYNRWAQGSLLADWQGVGLAERTIHVKRQNVGTPWERIDINYEANAPDGTRRQFNSMGNTLAEAEQQATFPLGRWLETHPLGAAPATEPAAVK